VFFGNGDGTFRPQLTFDGIASMTADFNRDGKIDVLVILSTGQLAVCLGRGDGSFGNDLVLTPPFVADSFVAGDFNGDGLIDLAIAPVLNSAAADLAVFLGNGDGTFRAPIVARGALPGRIFAAADINGDGKLDLIAGNGVLAGLGDGRFHPPVFFGVGNTACIAGRGPGFPGFLCSPVYAAAVAADFSGPGLCFHVRTVGIHGNRGSVCFGPAERQSWERFAGSRRLVRYLDGACRHQLLGNGIRNESRRGCAGRHNHSLANHIGWDSGAREL
jgi:FG-GAP-like repeat